MKRALAFAVLHDVAAHVEREAEPGFSASIARALGPDGRLLVVEPIGCLSSFDRGGAASLVERLEAYGLVLDEGLAALPPKEREARLREGGLRFRAARP